MPPARLLNRRFKVGIRENLSYQAAVDQAWHRGFRLGKSYEDILRFVDGRYKKHKRIPTPYHENWQKKELPKISERIYKKHLKELHPLSRVEALELIFDEGGPEHIFYSMKGWHADEVRVLKTWVHQALASRFLQVNVKYELSGLGTITPLKVGGAR
tara:strand:- start:1402 stop:1872 length:471 start_codon:yes stop_codon:yes gene_type:complete